MATRPPDLIYAVDERPPAITLLLLGLQHIFTMSSMLILPVIIVEEIGGSFIEITSVVSFSMIAAGAGTIIQSFHKGPVGSGYLCPNLCGPSFLGVTLQAGWLGGLPLMHGMIMIACLTEILFSRIVHKLHRLFPTEITGLVVLMVGITLIPLGASKFVGVEYPGDRIDPLQVLVAIISLFTMIGINIWIKGRIRLYSVLIGITTGYILSILLGFITPADESEIAAIPFFSLPGKGIELFHFSFNLNLLIPFILVAIIQSLKTFGNLTTCQKLNDSSWKTPDMKNIGKGLFADGISVFLGGFLGGVATDSSASNVGLSAATGATSRSIAWIAGGLFILLGFFPKISALITIMPAPVMGAIIVFVTSFMILSGIQIIMTTTLNTRKIFILGISMVIGLSVDIAPSLYTSLPGYLQPIFSSSLTVSTLLAVILNQILSIGKHSSGPNKAE